MWVFMGIHGIIFSQQISFFRFRSINCIKNKLYSKIRKLACDLMEFQKQNFKTWRNSITHEKILTIFDINNGIRQQIYQNGHKENGNNKILRNSYKILRKVFIEEPENSNIDFMKEVVTHFKQLNFKLKSLRIYKNKLKKNWKLTDRSLRIILKANNVIIDQ